MHVEVHGIYCFTFVFLPWYRIHIENRGISLVLVSTTKFLVSCHPYSPPAAAGLSCFLLSPLLPRCLAPDKGHTNRPPVLLLLDYYESSQGLTWAEHLLRSLLIRTIQCPTIHCFHQRKCISFPSIPVNSALTQKGQPGAVKLLRWSFLTTSLTGFLFCLGWTQTVLVAYRATARFKHRGHSLLYNI